MDLLDLKAFHGYQSSFIPFSSSYYIYLASWDSTPTRISSFSNLWLITPDNKRILFSDPPASSEIVCLYHVFDEIWDASISLESDVGKQLNIRCESINGDQEIEVELDLKETLWSRLIVGLSGSPPTSIKVSKPILAISDFLVNLLVAKQGSKIFGKTEKGKPYYHGATDRLFTITRGSATLNGKTLGNVTAPTWPLEFGDSVPFLQPVIKIGNLHIPFKNEMLEGGE